MSPADAQPTEAEREIWEEVDVVLKDAKAILDELQAYKGAGPDIREVRSSTPSLQDTHAELQGDVHLIGGGGVACPLSGVALVMCIFFF